MRLRLTPLRRYVVERYEEPKYEISSNFSGFEVRRYADSVQARVRTEGKNWKE